MAHISKVRFSIHDLFSFVGFTLPDIGCAHVLGMEDHAIPDSAITASTEWHSSHGASNARLNFINRAGKTGGWSARHNDKGQWLQIDLGKVRDLTFSPGSGSKRNMRILSNIL